MGASLYLLTGAAVAGGLVGTAGALVGAAAGFGVAAGMSLGFFLLYWAFLIGGEKLADREMLSPFLSMWSANFILGAAGLYLTFKNLLNAKQILKVFKSKY